MISTIHRRNILSFIEKEGTTPMAKLKKEFIESGYMNQTTLYRILEKFLSESLIHKAEFNNEKFFTLCTCKKKVDKGVKLQCCITCHEIEDTHFPLGVNSLHSETIELIKHCNHCSQ